MSRLKHYATASGGHPVMSSPRSMYPQRFLHSQSDANLNPAILAARFSGRWTDQDRINSIMQDLNPVRPVNPVSKCWTVPRAVAS